jgi:hypothetical protein
MSPNIRSTNCSSRRGFLVILVWQAHYRQMKGNYTVSWKITFVWFLLFGFFPWLLHLLKRQCDATRWWEQSQLYKLPPASSYFNKHRWAQGTPYCNHPGLYLGYYVASKLRSSIPGPNHGISYREGRFPSRPTWGTTSLRNCAPLSRVQTMGYHIGRAVSHRGLPGVQRRFETSLLYPRSNPWDREGCYLARPTWSNIRRFETALLYPGSKPWDIISGGLFPIQAYLG